MFKFGKKPVVDTEPATAPVTEENVTEEIVTAPAEEAASGNLPLVSIKNLFKAYGKKQVLNGLSLDVYEGELVGLLGKNGVGKSTTLDCVIGSKEYNSGEIILNNYNIKLDPIEAKRSFGYVASEPACYDVMTGYDYLEFVASIYEISEGEFMQNARYLCGRLGLEESELFDRVCDYSHGMKQKLSLVASLLHNPKVWILDEPTVGLDIMTVEELKKMMREYANHGHAVLVASHNIDLVSGICDKVALINDGKVAFSYDLNKQPARRIQLTKIFMSLYNNKRSN